MTLMLYVHTIIIMGELYKGVAGLSNVGAVGEKFLPEALLLAIDFFIYYLRIFLAKDISTARNKRTKESFGTETAD